MKRKTGISFDDLVGPPDDTAPAAPATPSTSTEVTGGGGFSEGETVREIVPLTIHITPEDRMRLKILSAQTGLSLQKIGLEAFSLFLAAKGLPGLERVNASVPDGRKGKRRR